jgi:hypothetical protein
VTEALEHRLRRHQSRLAVRAWEYRQRNHARGVWFRLRRVLADASRAYVLTEEDAQTLLAEGYLPEPVGAELEPAKTIIFAPAERIARVAAAREIPVSLQAEMLETRCVALLRFP